MTFFDHFANRATDLGSTKYITPANQIGQRGAWQKMIDVSVPDKDAALIAVSLRSEYDIDPATGLPNTGQPLVAWIQWGVGGGENQVEFDIPPAKYPQGLAPQGHSELAPMMNIGGGVTVMVYASHVSVYARHDGQMASIANVVQRGVLPPNDPIGNICAAKILAFLGPGTAQRSIIERTIFVAGGTVPGEMASQLAPGAGMIVSVPPFSKSVRFQRSTPHLNPLAVECYASAGLPHRTFYVPVNSDAYYPLDASTIALSIYNQGATNLEYLQAVFDVTPS